MERDELEQHLKAVHEELEQTSSLDAESRELLVTVLHDIERLLEKQSAEQATSEGESDSILDQLKSATERFEESHPFVATLIGRIADGLGNLGI